MGKKSDKKGPATVDQLFVLGLDETASHAALGSPS
jgi:hypothetical protein